MYISAVPSTDHPHTMLYKSWVILILLCQLYMQNHIKLSKEVRYYMYIRIDYTYMYYILTVQTVLP